jgi:CubicO group peptidase (beta-lactamase class C family)
MRHLLLALAVFAGIPMVTHAQPAADIDERARHTMKEWHVPGLALVVVRDDRCIFLKGFGVRETGKPEPVNADTLFPIASCTKSFTTLAMGMLVDEEKLDWDEPARKHVPYFRLSDPLADASVTLRDLVTHRTGVAAHDLLWYGGAWPLEERIRHACRLDLSAPFRTSFRYQVVFFGAAGVAVGNAAGITWQDFVQKRVFDALVMKRSRCTFAGDEENVASPHKRDAAGKLTVVPRFPLREADPAGSIHSTARDLAAYLRFQLGDGTWLGKRLISADSLAEPQTPQVVLRLQGAARAMNPESQFLNYGMGWIVQDYRGKRLLMHGGSIDGFRAHLTLVPELRLGIGLLSNLDGGLANVSLSNSIVDLALGAPRRDWIAHYLQIFEDGEREDAARARELRAKRDPEHLPPRPLKAYTGAYHDPAYGDCRIELEDGKLYWSWQKVRSPLEHYQGDAFIANYGPLVDTGFFFAATPTGTVEGFRAFDRTFRRKS